MKPSKLSLQTSEVQQPISGGNELIIKSIQRVMIGDSDSRLRREMDRRGIKVKGVRDYRGNRAHNKTSYKNNQKWGGEEQRGGENL